MVLLLLATLLNVSQANNQTKPQLDGLRYFNANQRDDIEVRNEVFIWPVLW